jgi:hypothetical protein
MQRTQFLFITVLFLVAAGIVAGLVFLAVASEEDVTPPVITSVSAYHTPSGARITWFTDEPATSEVRYTPPAGDIADNSIASPWVRVVYEDGKAWVHVAYEELLVSGLSPYEKPRRIHHVGLGTLEGPLEPETTYTFKVISVDGAGNEAVSDEYKFTTWPLP